MVGLEHPENEVGGNRVCSAHALVHRKFSGSARLK